MSGDFEKLLSLSTAHIPKHAVDSLDSGSVKGVRVADHQYGWIVFFGEMTQTSLIDEWLRPIVEFAKAGGCLIINFDEAADEFDEFKKYDW